VREKEKKGERKRKCVTAQAFRAEDDHLQGSREKKEVKLDFVIFMHREKKEKREEDNSVKEDTTFLLSEGEEMALKSETKIEE